MTDRDEVAGQGSIRNFRNPLDDTLTQQTAPQPIGECQQMLILTEVIISYFGEPSPQESFGIPPKPKASVGGMTIPTDHGKCLASAGSQFRQDANSGIISLDAREMSAVPKHLFEGRTFTGLSPYNGKALAGDGIVRNMHVT